MLWTDLGRNEKKTRIKPENGHNHEIRWQQQQKQRTKNRQATMKFNLNSITKMYNGHSESLIVYTQNWGWEMKTKTKKSQK